MNDDKYPDFPHISRMRGHYERKYPHIIHFWQSNYPDKQEANNGSRANKNDKTNG